MPLAHPVSPGKVAILERSLQKTAQALGTDARMYTRIFGPMVSHSESLLGEFLQPIIHIPRYPLVAMRFGALALLSARQLVRSHGLQETAGALLAGLAAHSFLPLSSSGSAAFCLMLGMLGHAVGWPIPKGGAQMIAKALLQHLRTLGGKIQTGVFITSLSQLPRTRAILLDITPRQLIRRQGISSRSGIDEHLSISGMVQAFLRLIMPWTGRFRGFMKFANGLEQFTLEEHSTRLRNQRPRLPKADVPIDRSCRFPNRHCLIQSRAGRSAGCLGLLSRSQRLVF